MGGYDTSAVVTSLDTIAKDDETVKMENAECEDGKYGEYKSTIGEYSVNSTNSEDEITREMNVDCTLHQARTDIAPVVKKSKLADSVGLSKGLSREKGDRSHENLRKSLSPQLSPDPPEIPVLHDCCVADQAPVDSVGSPVLCRNIGLNALEGCTQKWQRTDRCQGVQQTPQSRECKKKPRSESREQR